MVWPKRIFVWISAAAVLVSRPSAAAEQPLTIDDYVTVVMRSHPAFRQAAGLEDAARAERKAVRLFPDPSFDVRAAAPARTS